MFVKYCTSIYGLQKHSVLWFHIIFISVVNRKSIEIVTWEETMAPHPFPPNHLRDWMVPCHPLFQRAITRLVIRCTGEAWVMCAHRYTVKTPNLYRAFGNRKTRLEMMTHFWTSTVNMTPKWKEFNEKSLFDNFLPRKVRHQSRHCVALFKDCRKNETAS